MVCDLTGIPHPSVCPSTFCCCWWLLRENKSGRVGRGRRSMPCDLFALSIAPRRVSKVGAPGFNFDGDGRGRWIECGRGRLLVYVDDTFVIMTNASQLANSDGWLAGQQVARNGTRKRYGLRCSARFVDAEYTMLR